MYTHGHKNMYIFIYIYIYINDRILSFCINLIHFNNKVEPDSFFNLFSLKKDSRIVNV